MSRQCARNAGFTLIELLVAIVLAAIVASFIVLFLDAPVQSYFAQTRRADLVDSADRIADAVTADVRTALPNSIRSKPAGSAKALELLATEGAARYYAAGDKPATTGEELAVGTPLPSFSTLDSFNTQALPYQAPYVAVGNLGPPTYDAYNSASGVITPAAVRINVSANPGAPPPPGENQVAASSGTMTFANAPAPHQAYLVSGPVSYVCDPVAGTFRRYSGYAVTAAQSVPPAGASALIAHDVSACGISFGVANPQYGQLAILTVTLTSGGESLRVFLEIPTEYVQ
ncbi:MAG: PulJ/GspJ family protein [Steroidobacteraceae bacterium]